MYASSAGVTMSATPGFYNPRVPPPDGFPPEEYERLVATRRDLHRHPELAYEESRTARIAAVRLRELGLSLREGVGGTGVVADLGTTSPRILYRADMDALPLAESEGDRPCVSTIPDRMHACGHDGHIAIALAVAARLSAAPPPVSLRFLCQPAEEGRGGAQACVRDGALEGVDATFGLHLWSSLPVGKIG